jgi:hypothetical protein
VKLIPNSSAHNLPLTNLQLFFIKIKTILLKAFLFLLTSKRGIDASQA